MTKSDLELFKEALAEGLSIRFQNEIDSYQEEIIISERHERAMRTIFNGAQVRPILWPSARAKIAAVIVAATMILASCAAVYSEEIRGFIETIYGDYISVGFENPDESPKQIEEYYELTYLPEGYYIKNHVQNDFFNKYMIENIYGDTIIFNQTLLSNNFIIDSEHGQQYMIYIKGNEIYCNQHNDEVYYIWNDGKYAMMITSSIDISGDIENIINGIVIQ